MNKKQLVAMWAGIIVFTLLCLNPPIGMRYVTSGGGGMARVI